MCPTVDFLNLKQDESPPGCILPESSCGMPLLKRETQSGMVSFDQVLQQNVC